MKTTEIKLQGFKNLTETQPEIKLQRTICAIAASFNTVDDSGELILPGAFKKSIEERGPQSKTARKIVHVWCHDQTRPLGKIAVLREQTNGLYFESKLFDNDEGNNALAMYLEGGINQHSIGFNYNEVAIARRGSDLWNHVYELCKNRKAMDTRDEVYILNELDLYEISSVCLGLNEFTNTLDIKTSQVKEIKYASFLDYAIKHFKM